MLYTVSNSIMLKQSFTPLSIPTLLPWRLMKRTIALFRNTLFFLAFFYSLHYPAFSQSDPGTGLVIDQQKLFDRDASDTYPFGWVDPDNLVGDSAGVAFDIRLAQSFKPHFTGTLRQIRIPIGFRTGMPGANIHLAIMGSDENGAPDSTTILGSVEVPPSDIGGVDLENPVTWTSFDISDLDVRVNSGEELYFTLQTADSMGYILYYDTLDERPYAAGGLAWINAAADSVWSLDDWESDFGFQTLVEVDLVLDQENTLDGSFVRNAFGWLDPLSEEGDSNGTRYNIEMAQSFTVGAAGKFGIISLPVLYFNERPFAPVSLTLMKLESIESMDNATPLGSVQRAEMAFNQVDPTDPSTWARFDLSPLDIQVDTGDMLAFVVSANEPFGYQINPEIGDESTLYAQGQAFQRNVAVDSTWAPISGDFGFQTFRVGREGMLTFAVDMNRELAMNPEDFASGRIVGLRGNVAPLDWGATTLMQDPDEDGIFTVEIPFVLEPGTVIEYLFVHHFPTSPLIDGWEGGVGSGEFGSRQFVFEGDAALETVFFKNITGTALEKDITGSFELGHPYPNPASGTVTVEFSLPHQEQVQFVLLDILGREVIQFQHKVLQAGQHQVRFDTGSFSNGVYFYRLEAGPYQESRKMIVLN